MADEYTTPFATTAAPNMFGAGPPGFPMYMGGGGGSMPGAMMMMLLQPLLQGMMGSRGQVMGQFVPQQGLYDQFLAQRYYQQQMQAGQMAGLRDQAQMQQFTSGVTQMFTTGPLSAKQQQQANTIGSSLAGMMPYLSMFLGPEMVDRLHGTRGSAAVMSQQMFEGMRTGLDPVTGQVGFSGKSAGVVAQDVYEQLYGARANISDMRGISAGQAGSIFKTLQQRGLAGAGFGALSMEERLGQLAGLTQADITRIAERTVKPDATQAERDAAKLDVEKTYKDLTQIHARGGTVSQADLEKMVGGEDILRASDANRISRRLKDMAGSVAAMREIFGDMGHPNAPMHELVQALDALTQGGLTTMSPGRVEEMVRRTHAIARQTGMGIEGMLALSGQGAALADKLGLDRGYVPLVTQHAALYGAAAGDSQKMEIPTFGALSKEKLTLLDQQLTTQGAASPVGNQLAILMRLSETGAITPGKSARVDQMIADIKAGRGNEQMFMGADQFISMLEGAGVDPAVVTSMLTQRQANQEYGQQYDIANIMRQGPQRVQITRRIGAAFGSEVAAAMTAKNYQGAEMQQAAGVIGQKMVEKYMSLDMETLRDPKKRDRAMAEFLKGPQGLRAALPPGTDVDKFIKDLGGDSGLRTLAGLAVGRSDQQIVENPYLQGYGSTFGVRQAHDPLTAQNTTRRSLEAEAAAEMASALSGVGMADPIRRTIDAIADATPGTTIDQILMQTMGGVPMEAIAKKHPVMRQMQRILARQASPELRDPTTHTLTPMGRAEITELARQVRVLDTPALARAELDRINDVKGRADKLAALQKKHGTMDMAELEKRVVAGGDEDEARLLVQHRFDATRPKEWDTAVADVAQEKNMLRQALADFSVMQATRAGEQFAEINSRRGRIAAAGIAQMMKKYGVTDLAALEQKVAAGGSKPDQQRLEQLKKERGAIFMAADAAAGIKQMMKDYDVTKLADLEKKVATGPKEDQERLAQLKAADAAAGIQRMMETHGVTDLAALEKKVATGPKEVKERLEQLKKERGALFLAAGGGMRGILGDELAAMVAGMATGREGALSRGMQAATGIERLMAAKGADSLGELQRIMDTKGAATEEERKQFEEFKKDKGDILWEAARETDATKLKALFDKLFKDEPKVGRDGQPLAQQVTLSGPIQLTGGNITVRLDSGKADVALTAGSPGINHSHVGGTV